MDIEGFMRRAIELSREKMESGAGGYCASLVVKEGEVVGEGWNTVLQSNDPTAHCEINAIRAAGQRLGTWDLSGCELYSTWEPCPMCVAAISWARISRVYYANLLSDAADLGMDVDGAPRRGSRSRERPRSPLRAAARGRSARCRQGLVGAGQPAAALTPNESVRNGRYCAAVRLVIARCEVRYSGRLTATLPEAVRLLVFKADGSVMVHSDAGGFKPQNWMTAPTTVEEHGNPLELIVVRKAKTDDRLDIAIGEVLSDVTHDMGEAAALEKEGVEGELQAALAAAPEMLDGGLRLVRREWPTDIGPVDLVCRDEADGWVAIEVKRIATIEAVEQLTRYLERLGCRARRARLAGDARRPGRQATSAHAGAGTRDRMRRSRPRRPPRRRRALADAVLTTARRAG